MLLTLSKTIDADNTIIKTLTEPHDFNIVLKGDVDLMRPILRLVRVAGLDYNNFNYASIPMLNRFYFIRNIRAINYGVFEFELECDFLFTYRNDILNSNARLFRTIKTGDYFDANIDSSLQKTMSIHESSKGFEGEKSLIMTTVGS